MQGVGEVVAGGYRGGPNIYIYIYFYLLFARGRGVAAGGIRGPPIKKMGGKFFSSFLSSSFSFSFTPPTFECKDDLSMCTGVGGGVTVL